MSEALQMVVAALVAELQRQAEASGPTPYVGAGDIHSAVIDGHVDLEKLARAALGRLKSPPDDLLEEIWARSTERDWVFLLEAILA